jgi:hypothetical protein
MLQSKLDRKLIFAKRLIYSFFKSFTPKRIVGRINGPKVLVNSIPKSGTNLIDKVMYNLPNMHFSGKRTIRKMTHSIPEAINAVQLIRKGQYSLAHLEFDEKISAAVDDNQIKKILVIRDPRQILVSHYKYVTYIDSNHKSHTFFKSLPNDEERLNAVIDGFDGIVEPLEVVIKGYLNWLKNKNCLIIRYEDLIGEKGGGSTDLQFNALHKILHHLEIQLSESEILTIRDKIFDENSPTFRSGQLDSWKSELTLNHKKKIKENLGDLIISLGYEKDNNW